MTEYCTRCGEKLSDDDIIENEFGYCLDCFIKFEKEELEQ